MKLPGYRSAMLYAALCCLLLLPAVVYAQQAPRQDTLTEIVIKSHAAVKQSGDTITYAADSVTRNPLATVEDVLKRLPGVHVDGGKITVQGKPVEKILLNGKEYPATDIRTLTQSMPAEMLDKVQVTDWYSDAERFSGMKKDAEQKAINLQLKKQYGHGTYTRALGAYGANNRYQAGLFGNYMKDTLVATLAGGLNNTASDNLWGSIAADTKAAQAPGTGTKKNISCNVSFAPSKRLTLTATYEAGAAQNYLHQTMFRSTFFGDSVLLSNRSSDGYANNTYQSFRLQSRFVAGDKLTMISTIAAGWQKNTSYTTATDMTAYHAGQPVFYRSSSVSAATKTPVFSLQHTLLKRFDKKRRTLSLTIDAKYAGLNEESIIANTNRYLLPEGTTQNLVEKNAGNNQLHTQIALQYTEPVTARSAVNIKYTNDLSIVNSFREVWQDTGRRYVDTLQGRSYTQRYAEHPFSVSYQYQSDKLLITAGIGIKYYQRSIVLFRPSGEIVASGVNYMPDVFVKYNFSKRANLKLSYRSSADNPDLLQLQPIPDYADSFNIFIGNPGLKPERQHMASLVYNYFSLQSQQALTCSIRAKATEQKIIGKADVNTSRRITSLMNAGNAYGGELLLNYTQPVFTKQVRLFATMSCNMNENLSVTNNVMSDIYTMSWLSGAKFIFTGKIVEGECGYTYKAASISTAQLQQRALQTHTATFSGLIYLPLHARLGFSMNYICNTGLAGNLNNTFLPVNCSLEKSFMRPKGLCVRVQAYDVFNNYPDVQRSTGDNYIEDRTVNRLGRYGLFSVVYSCW